MQQHSWLNYLRCFTGPTLIVSTTAVFLRLSASSTGMNCPVPASLPLFEALAMIYLLSDFKKTCPRSSGYTSDMDYPYNLNYLGSSNYQGSRMD